MYLLLTLNTLLQSSDLDLLAVINDITEVKKYALI
jgi:hypothetical protein